jgi:ABC-type cobalt transport system substrate-binding protein
MRKLVIVAIASLVLAALPCHAAKWQGVDESVVEKFAEKAGRPARKPLINTDQGDLLLFVFLVAGAAGGFVAGYYFRELFPGKAKKEGVEKQA